jgi:hypothetical protein
MVDFNQEVPDFLAKLVGHVCGLIFVLMAILSSLAVYIQLSKPSIGALLLLLTSLTLTYFFGRTAFILSSKTSRKVVSKAGFIAAATLLGLISFLIIATTLIGYEKDEIELFQASALTLLSGATTLLAYLLFKYVKRNF